MLTKTPKTKPAWMTCPPGESIPDAAKFPESFKVVERDGLIIVFPKLGSGISSYRFRRINGKLLRTG
jgi:hypothetical protein